MTSVIIGLSGVCVGGLTYWWFRWTTATRAPRSLQLYFTLARATDVAQVRRQATEAVIALGEELANAPPSDDLDRALDAYRAASLVLDQTPSLVDLVGVLVLVNQGRGGGALCFFNPLHGPSVRATDWRLIGTREQVQVPACAACRQAVRKHRPPAALPDHVHGKDIAYFEADPARSVWAATGFGTLHDDLVERILRGDTRHRR